MHQIVKKGIMKIMKKFLFVLIMLLSGVTFASAQADIRFDKVIIDFGTIGTSNPVRTTSFTFTNTGDKPLVINQVAASCGCTVPKYDKKPIAPGQKGTISVKYNGKGARPGHIKKCITVRTNGKTEMTRLYIEGDIVEQ